jgi:hypothetical protein
MLVDCGLMIRKEVGIEARCFEKHNTQSPTGSIGM